MEEIQDIIKWEEKYNVGIKSIDEQHRKIVDLINKSFRLLMGETTFNEVLLEALEYIDVHFEYEEKLMRDSGYEKYHEHKSIHAAFINEIWDLYEEYRTGASANLSGVSNTGSASSTTNGVKGQNMSSKLVHFFSKWMIQHIQGEDRGYVAAVKAKGLG